MRDRIIAGNWKLNTSLEEGENLARQTVELTKQYSQSIKVVICPPATHLYCIGKITKNTHVGLGSQNVNWEDAGAFTGEISAPVLKSLGCDFVIIGHSERRTLFGETDSSVNKRVKHTLNAGLRPIMCIGETLEEREQHKTFEVLKRQLTIGLEDIDLRKHTDIVIAYEPVWAIGTGRNATPEQAQEAHAFIRQTIASLSSVKTANQIPILYGGSVNDKNAAELLKMSDLDGALVGGASLNAGKFAEIVKGAFNS